MHGLAQSTGLDWFSNMMRVRAATQSCVQRKTTLVMLQSGLDTELRQHEQLALATPTLNDAALKAALFRTVFLEISAVVMATIASGLNEEEQVVIIEANELKERSAAEPPRPANSL